MNKLIDYEGLGNFREILVNDSSISEKSTWSSDKLNANLGAKQNLLTAGQNISIDASNNISADGYVFDSSNYSFATKYRDEEDPTIIGTNIATGNESHAEGIQTTATGDAAHAEGAWGTVASGNYSHAEGGATQATNSGSHAEGQQTVASGKYSHAEGNYPVASGKSAHAEGGRLSGQNPTTAAGNQSHAEGGSTLASGQSSHAEGELTEAKNGSEHAQGICNVSHKNSDTYGDAGNTIDSIGIGNVVNNIPQRKNATEVMQNGDMYLFGVGGYQGTDTKVQNASILTLQDVVNRNNLSAGTNISISNNIISATGYTNNNGSITTGWQTVATGAFAHAHGYWSESQGIGSFADGVGSIVKNEGEHAVGIYNISHKASDYTHLNETKISGNTQYSIGMGWSNAHTYRKNAFEVMQNGDAYLYGVGGYDGVHIKNEDPSINVQTLQEYISSLEARIYALEHPSNQ